MASNAGKAISNFGSGLVDGLKNKLGIHSPSTIFRDKVRKIYSKRCCCWNNSRYR